jgi:hypothetical protein
LGSTTERGEGRNPAVRDRLRGHVRSGTSGEHRGHSRSRDAGCVPDRSLRRTPAVHHPVGTSGLEAEAFIETMRVSRAQHEAQGLEVGMSEDGLDEPDADQRRS